MKFRPIIKRASKALKIGDCVVDTGVLGKPIMHIVKINGDRLVFAECYGMCDHSAKDFKKSLKYESSNTIQGFFAQS